MNRFAELIEAMGNANNDVSIVNKSSQQMLSDGLLSRLGVKISES